MRIDQHIDEAQTTLFEEEQKEEEEEERKRNKKSESIVPKIEPWSEKGNTAVKDSISYYGIVELSSSGKKVPACSTYVFFLLCQF